MPALFEGVGAGILGRRFTCLPVKYVGLALSDPTLTPPNNWTASCVITVHLVAELRCLGEFRTENHTKYLREGIEGVHRRNARRSNKALVENLVFAPDQVTHCLRQVTKTGTWQTMQWLTVNGTEMGT